MHFLQKGLSVFIATQILIQILKKSALSISMFQADLQL